MADRSYKVAHDAATILVVSTEKQCHVVLHMAVGDGALPNGFASDTPKVWRARTHVNVEACVGQGDVFHKGTIADVAEESTICHGRRSRISADTADDVAGTVEGATEWMGAVTDGSEVVFLTVAVPFGGIAIVDVIGDLEDDALEVVAAIHCGGQLVEVGGRGDEQGVGSCTIAFPCHLHERLGCGGESVAVVVAGDVGLHPVGAGSGGDVGGVGTVLSRGILVGNGTAAEVVASAGR